MTAQTRTARPTSVPTSAEERNSLWAIIRSFGEQAREFGCVHPSSNGATLRKLVAQLLTARAAAHDEAIVLDARFEDARIGAVHARYVREQDAREIEAAAAAHNALVPALIAEGNAIAAADRAARLSAGARKAWETRRAWRAAQASAEAQA